MKWTNQNEDCQMGLKKNTTYILFTRDTSNIYGYRKVESQCIG